ncbi:MAG: leucine-rich repeat domain-containing protein [Spirochaetota bacterium]|jgi:hypothetical protein|nr:leucine-rich repeat domain-containing protein [Spirochaetota bacterium]
MKRCFVWVLVLAFVFLGWKAEPPQSNAVQEASGKDFTVIMTDDHTGVVITQYTGTAAVVRIPAKIQDMPVFVISRRAFYGNKNITSVIIPEGVSNIGDFAFESCPNLASVILPQSLVRIGQYAFRWCVQLKALTLPENVQMVGSGAFMVTALESITLPAGLTKLPDWMFSGCANLRSVHIPEGVTHIPDYIFGGTALAAITLPASIRSIGELSFRDCADLVSVVVPETVTKIIFADKQGNYAFKGSPNLSLVTQKRLIQLGYPGWAFRN